MSRIAALSLIVAATACGDLSTPAELTHPQILAVRAESPAIPEGERTRLEVWVAGPEGLLAPASLAWSVVATGPSTEPLGRIELEGDDAYYVAPDEVAGIQGAAVQVVVGLEDGTELVAIKAIGVGVPQPTANPTITALRVDGESVAPDGVMSLRTGVAVTLDFEVEPGPTDDAVVSWHATLGELDGYLSRSAELLAPTDPGSGELFLVYRDGAGGVAVRQSALQVQ